MGQSEISFTVPYIFYLIGLSPCNPRTSRKVINTVPSLLLLFCMVVVTIATFIFQYMEHNLHTEVVINIPTVFFIFLCSFTCLTIIYKSIVSKRTIENVWQRLRSIEYIYNMHNQQPMNFKIFYRLYSVNVGVAIILHLQHIFVRISFNYGTYDIIVKSMTWLLLSVIYATMFHMVFYVRLVVFIMEQINERILLFNVVNNEIIHSNMWTQNGLMKNFKNIKQIHYLLYDISVMINQHFGWIIVSIFILIGYDSIHTAFWIVWYMERNSTAAVEQAKMLSKY